ncbi:MAG: response regulator [Salinarimonas sp.]
MRGALAGLRILVVEDEFIVALAAEDMLGDLGAEVVGPAATVGDGLVLAAEPLDAALLDINMHGERSFAVARALRARGIPFVFATGYADAGCAELADAPILRKPYGSDALAAALLRALGA